MPVDEKSTSFVTELTPAQAEKLAELLRDRGWEMGEAPHALWKASRDKTSAVAYKSGKLTLQGKGTYDFVTFILEPEVTGVIIDDKPKKEEPERPEITLPHAGIDESGKGDFFGPLVVAAVYADDASSERMRRLGVTDSKKIKSAGKIAMLATEIRKAVGGKFTTVKIGPAAYNRMHQKLGNVNLILAWGHARALENLLEKEPGCGLAISDKFGNERLIKNALMQKGAGVELRQFVRAESDIAVAAASILARDVFVREMKRLGEEMGRELPLGAGTAVDATAVEILREKGEEALFNCAKTHFRTLQKAVDTLSGKAPEE